MSAFTLQHFNGGPAVRLLHRDSKSWFGVKYEPYLDNWPVDRRITRWVGVWRLFGIRFWTQTIWKRKSMWHHKRWMA